ncbi:MAG: hypothetical protein VR70_17550 [Rhodospirillaceae bacterium BRH_c57]|nr:MAG: hypothetical protein VR70_17550 [Rhodospirillaceae bacterium BRH_c57]
MTYDPLQAWRLAWQTQEMMTAAALTIGLRTFAMGEAMVGLRPHDHRENQRMVSEKMKAAAESAKASALLWPQLMAASPTAAWGLWLRLGSGGLRPYHSRTTANVARLMSKRLR